MCLVFSAEIGESDYRFFFLDHHEGTRFVLHICDCEYSSGTILSRINLIVNFMYFCRPSTFFTLDWIYRQCTRRSSALS